MNPKLVFFHHSIENQVKLLLFLNIRVKSGLNAEARPRPPICLYSIHNRKQGNLVMQ